MDFINFHSNPLTPLLFFNLRSCAVAAVSQYYKACWIFHVWQKGEAVRGGENKYISLDPSAPETHHSSVSCVLPMI